MRKEIIETVVYEMGDVLDITDVLAERQTPHAIKTKTFNKAKRALVMDVQRTRTTGIVYKIVCENARAYTLKMSELGREKFIKHIDMPDVFELTTDEIAESKTEDKNEEQPKKDEKKEKDGVIVGSCKHCKGFTEGYCKHKNSPFYGQKVRPDGFCFEAPQK